MYFDKFLDGSYAASESVSHIDILTSALEGAEFAADAEIALIEEDGRLCMTVGAEGIGDAMAAVADKAKEVGTKIWKWLVEFVRKVRAFVSQAIVSLRNGAIINTLKKIIAKGKTKAKNDEWKENAPKPERVTKWNVDVQRALNGIWFISQAAVDKLMAANSKLAKKADKAEAKTASFGADGRGANPGATDDDGTFEAILEEIPKIKDEEDHNPYSRHSGLGDTKTTNTKWLERLGPEMAKMFKLDSEEPNERIINKALNLANTTINKMKNDPILKMYDALKVLDTEVAIVKKLCADAGKDGAKELKRIKKYQKAVSKVGTTCTLFCRRQLGSYKKLTALIMRLYSMAGSMEKEDYNED